MIQDWLKENVVAVLVGTVIGGAAIGSSVVYVVQPRTMAPPAVPSVPAPAAAPVTPAAPASPPPPDNVAFPMRFTVQISGRVGSMGSIYDGTKRDKIGAIEQ